MKFAQTGAESNLTEALSGMVDSGRIPHAIMFSEQDGGGAVGVALAFLQYLFCKERKGGDSCGVCPSCNRISKLIHPDVHFIFPTTSPSTSVAFYSQWRELVLSNPNFTEGELNEALGIEGKNSMIAVAEAKAMLSDLSMSALEGGYRAVLIYLPEKMNQEAANRLLKVIEEPPEKTQFLLITHAPEKVLQTIASRCQRIHVAIKGNGRKAGYAEPERLAEMLRAVASRDLISVLDAADAIAASGSRENARAFFKYASEVMRDMFITQQGVGTASGPGAELAGLFKKTFPRQALAAFDRANMLVERNVNLKIVFSDLACRLYII